MSGSDGSVSDYNAAGVLTETIEANGDARVIEAAGSQYTAEILNPDGSFQSYEKDFPTGTAFYSASGKPIEWIYATGGTITFAADGSAVQINPDGTKLFYAVNGTTIVENPSGVIVERYNADGSDSYPISGGWADYTKGGVYLGFEINSTNGVVSRYNVTGTLVETDAADGSKTVYNSDGSVSDYNSGGVLTETIAADGSRTIYNSDGSVSDYNTAGVLTETIAASGSKAIYNSDGSVSDYNAAGVLTETIEANGDARVVEAAGSQYTAEILNPDGSFQSYEKDFPTGTAFYSASGKPIEWIYATGGTITFAADGSAVQINPDGTKLFYAVNGTTIVENPSGVIVERYNADGSDSYPISGGWADYTKGGVYLGFEINSTNGVVSRYNVTGTLVETDAADGSKTVYNSDGSVSDYNSGGVLTETIAADGSRTIYNSDGSVSDYNTAGVLTETIAASGSKAIYNSDGSVSDYNAAGVLTETIEANGDARVVEAAGSQYTAEILNPDGSFQSYEKDFPTGTAFYSASGKPIEWIYATGGTITFAADGSAVQINPDGTKLFYAVNGTTIVENPSGVIVERYNADGSDSYPISGGWADYTKGGVYLGFEINSTNGVVSRYNVTGTLVETDAADGSKTVYNSDGSVSDYNSGGVLTETIAADGSRTIYNSDGSVSDYNTAGVLTETIAASGSKAIYNSDGSVSDYNAAGVLTETIAANGNETIYKSDGSVEQFSSTGSLLSLATATGVTVSFVTGYYEVPAQIAIPPSSVGGLSNALSEAVISGVIENANISPSNIEINTLGRTASTNPIITGSAPPGDVVFLYATSSSGSVLIGESISNAGGGWTIQSNVSLQGAVDVSAIGYNPGDQTQTPSAPYALVILPDSAQMPAITAYATSSTVPGLVEFSGTAAPSASVELAQELGNNPELLTVVTADSQGNWTATIPLDALPFGTVSVVAQAANPIWGTSTWSAPVTLQVANPEAHAIEAGSDLQARLAYDAMTGTDATADLQALANEATGVSDTILEIPRGTYLLSGTVYLKSNTIIDSPGTTFEASNNWVLPSPNSPADPTIHYAMFANADWDNTTQPDTNISIENVTLNWAAVNSPGEAAIRILNASNVLIADDTFIGGGSGTAFENVNGAVVKNSIALNTLEYGFDNWAGPQNTIIENNTVYAGNFGGISMTGSQTDQTQGGIALNDSVVGNTIFGANRIGIDVSALNSQSSEAGILIAGNAIYGIGTGIDVTGNVNDAYVLSNKIDGSVFQSIDIQNLALAPAAPQVSNSFIVGNTIDHSNEVGNEVSAIVAQSNYANVINNTISNSFVPSAIWLAGTDELASGNVVLNTTVSVPVYLGWSSNVAIENTTVSQEMASGSTATLTSAGFTQGGGTLFLQEGLGQIVNLPDQPGLVVQTFAVPSTTDTTQMNYEAISPGFGAPGAPGTLTIIGSGNNDTIALGHGVDMVQIGGPNERIVGTDGEYTFYISAAKQGATIDGGTGISQIIYTPDEANDSFIMGSNITDISSVKLQNGAGLQSLTLNSIPFLQGYADDGQGVTLISGGPDQGLHAGQGADTLIGWSGGSTTFIGIGAALYNATLENLVVGDQIDFTDIHPTQWWNVVPDAGQSTLTIYDGQVYSSVNIVGTYSRDEFTLQSDKLTGSLLTLVK